jgi:hypothetical protein
MARDAIVISYLLRHTVAMLYSEDRDTLMETMSELRTAIISADEEEVPVYQAVIDLIKQKLVNKQPR